MLKLIISIVILLSLFYPTQNLFSQMPGWKFFKDYDGNTYYIDKNGKIRTSGKPEFKYKAVSVDGIDYYLNQGLELIKRANELINKRQAKGNIPKRFTITQRRLALI